MSWSLKYIQFVVWDKYFINWLKPTGNNSHLHLSLLIVATRNRWHSQTASFPTPTTQANSVAKPSPNSPSKPAPTSCASTSRPPTNRTQPNAASTSTTRLCLSQTTLIAPRRLPQRLHSRHRFTPRQKWVIAI